MKKSLSLANFLSTGALMVSLVIGAGTANAQSTPPARTYHVDQYGRETKEVKERWGENSSGQKHGIYVYYAKGGTPIEMYTYVNGIKSGPAYLIRDDGFYSISFRPTMKFAGGYANDKKQGVWTITNVGFQGALRDLDRKEVYVGGVLQKANTYRAGKITGSYSYSNGDRNGPAKVFGGTEAEYASGVFQNGKPSGTWLNAANSSEEIRYKKGYKLTFSDGKAVSATDAFGKPVALVSESEITKHLADTKAQQEDAKRRAALDPDFFISDQKLRQSFLTDQYNDMDGGTLTGAEIIKLGVLKDSQVIGLLAKNPEKVGMLLKMSGMELGKSPVEMIMDSPKLRPDIAESLLRIRSTRVSGEMLYWVLRGFKASKGVANPSLAERIITTIGNNNAEYKDLVENRFYDLAIAQKEYDPKEYPLRRWLYEQYKNDRPYLWMNKLTADTPSDASNYPERPH